MTLEELAYFERTGTLPSGKREDGLYALTSQDVIEQENWGRIRAEKERRAQAAMGYQSMWDIFASLSGKPIGQAVGQKPPGTTLAAPPSSAPRLPPKTYLKESPKWRKYEGTPLGDVLKQKPLQLTFDQYIANRVIKDLQAKDPTQKTAKHNTQDIDYELLSLMSRARK